MEPDPRQGSDDATQRGQIPLLRMRQQLGVRGPEDDWTGLASAAERRKVQNRLHQRAWRKRQSQAKRSARVKTLEDNSSQAVTELTGVTSDFQCSKDCGNERTGSVRTTSLCNLHPTEAQSLIDYFESWTLSHAALGCPNVDHLLTLTRFNVFRALVSNTHALGFPMNWLQPDAISLFNTDSSVVLPTSCPPHLRPSTLQRTVVHHPWLDLLPFPAMRNNVLRQGESFDDTPLCLDFVEFCDVSRDGGGTGLLVWGDPSNPRNWEVSEGALRKWGKLLLGCWELFEATNSWRAKRGQRLLPLPVNRTGSGVRSDTVGLQRE